MDLTNLLEKARANEKTWSLSSFENICQELTKQIPQTEIDFDYDAGEEWARIISSNKETNQVIALVRLDMPLIIFLEEYTINLSWLANHRNLTLITVSNMQKREYSINYEKISKVFPDNVWASEINHNSFSIDELWWTTVV